MEAVKACAALAKTGYAFSLTLVGALEDQTYLEIIEAAVKSLPDPQVVHITGHSASPEQYLRQADIFLFPSHGEGLGNAFLEAMAAGLVAVTFRNTVFPELQAKGFHFHMAADRDQNALARILIEVVQNLAEEKQLATTNRLLAHQSYSPERELDQWLQLLI